MIWNLEERQNFAKLYINNVIDGEIVSLLIIGDPGMGKTHLVTTMLEQAGYSRNQPDSIFSTTKKEYRHVSGHSSPMGLYRILYEHRHANSVIVFDDCDSIFSDKISTNILKAVLNTDRDKREVTWSSEGNVMGNLPKRFKFDGRVIFITNLKIDKIDKAVIDRTRNISLHMDVGDKTRMMEFMIDAPEFMPDVSIEIKRATFRLIREHCNQSSEFSIRKLKSAIIDYKTAYARGIDPDKAVLYSLNSKRNLSIKQHSVINDASIEEVHTGSLFQF